jgi:hypothetical protein
MPVKIKFMPMILKIILPSIILGIYHFVSRITLRAGVANLLAINLFAWFDYLILPILIILETVRRKRKYYGRSYKLAFYYCLLPGFIMSFDLSYGMFATGHGYGLANYIVYLKDDGFWTFIVISFFSGLIGLFVNFIWNKISKVKN